MQQLTADYIRSLLPAIPLDANKGSRGHQLNICGSYRMPGAAVICAKSAIRSGSGLVRVTVPDRAYPIVASHLVQPVFDPVATNSDGTFSSSAIGNIVRGLSWADSIVIGCGIGCNDDTRALVTEVLLNAECPVILDADGINSIIPCIDILKEVKAPIVLTPHPGEMARCVSSTVTCVQENRLEIARSFAAEYGVIVLLKGRGTIVTDGEKSFLNPTGNPSMAMGGTGDMLSGMIGSFAAQGIDPLDSACVGAYIHGMCGDAVASSLSVRGATVEDMMDQLGVLMSDFE